MNFEEDHDQLVRAELAQYGYVDEADDNALRRYLHLLDLKSRLVPVRGYKVYLSRELQAGPQSQNPVLAEVIHRLRGGLSVEAYLSKLAKQPRKKDDLLVHWGIHHLHLSPLATVDGNGYVARSDDVLFFRVEGGNAYFIDVLHHATPSVWQREELVRIVDSNWPQLHHQMSRTNARMVRRPGPSELKVLRRKNVNVPVQIGSRVVMPAFGAMTSGSSLSGLLDADRVALELRRLALLIRLNYTAWFPPSPSPVTLLRLTDVRKEGYVIADSASGVSRLMEPEQ
ncbi:hypothetical protein ACSFA7_14250 [Variovorax sp. LT1R20]|uniref:hypothetical protein n=1 Tax=Variovorax sp. LT1R20 TaxID=3443729 RepID=UPI003F480939